MFRFDNYPLTRVPHDKKASFMSVAFVHMGMVTALDQFMVGAVIGNSMTIHAALIAIALGSLTFGFVTFFLGLAGMREGISGSVLGRWCGFGRKGSILIGIVIAVSLIGWFGVQNAIFARSLNFAFNGKPGFVFSAIVSGMFLTIIVAIGFQALKIAARIAVPLFIMLVAFISYQVLKDHTLTEIMRVPPTGKNLGISDGITIVIGGAIVASLITPDLTRFSKNSHHVFGVTILTLFAGEAVVNGLAFLIARTLGTDDIVTIMSKAAGGIGLLIVVFSSLRVNDINLYSSTLGIINAVEGLTGFKMKYVPTTILTGILGTTLSVLGILDQFVDFLTLLAVIFPPIIGVMLVDYYIIQSDREILSESRKKNTLPSEDIGWGWLAIFSSLLGSSIGLINLPGIPAINSLLFSSIIYCTISYNTKSKKYVSENNHNHLRN